MRKDGLREVTITIGYDANGKQQKKHFYGKTMAEAKRKRNEYKQQALSGVNIESITLSQWIDRFCDVYKPKDMDYLINRLRRSLGTRPLKSIAEIDLQRELNSIAGMSTSHISKYAQIIKRIFLRARTNRKSPAVTSWISPGRLNISAVWSIWKHRTASCALMVR